MSDIEANKRVALAFITGLSKGQRDMSLLADDVWWWVPGAGRIERDTFLKIADSFRGLIAGPVEFEVSAITAEEDRVAVQASARSAMMDGRTYANDYHFLFYLRDGKICQVREHNNSLVPHQLFGDKLAAAALEPAQGV